MRSLGGNAAARLVVLLDGVPQADPFRGWIAWPSLDPRRLGTARVTRGGGTGANGPGALAGTIALDSLSPGEWRAASGASASLAARYAGAQFEDDLNRQRIGDALTLDATASLPIAASLAIEARVEKLTDTLVVTAISGAGIVERAAPRTVCLALRWRG